MTIKYTDRIQSNFPFDEFRPNQQEIISDITDSLYQLCNTFVLEAPTGIGKSVISYTMGKTLFDLTPKFQIPKKSDDEGSSPPPGPPILILTSTRQLQQQYIDSFKSKHDFKHLWSSKNYECAEYPLDNEQNKQLAVHFGHPMCTGIKRCHSAKTNNCKYLKQKKLFLNSKVGVTNYAYFTHARTLKPKILICDEAHNLQKILCDEASINLSIHQLDFIETKINRYASEIQTKPIDDLLLKLIELFETNEIKHSAFQHNQTLNDIKNYIGDAYDVFKTIYKQLEIILIKYANDEKAKVNISKLTKVKTTMSEIIKKYDKFLSSRENWVYHINKIKNSNKKLKETEIIEIKPIEVFEYYEDLIGKRTNKVLFMSATICGPKQFCDELGIDEFDFKQTSTTIPVENRAVHFVKNLGNMNYKNKLQVFPKFVFTIDRIIKYLYEKNKGKVNGIIHTVSFDNANRILARSKYVDDMLIPDKKQLMELDKILTNGKKNIIVSPSIMEGIDLIDDLSRFQIFIKVPYQSLGDIWVKTKLNMNSKWYSRSAIIKIVQGCGRSIRSDEDWAETFILDGSFDRLLKNDNELFPSWFKESVKTYDIQL